jgi:hypothetical protein
LKPPRPAADGEDPADFAVRVETAMQDALTDMTSDRIPLIG